MRRKSFRLGSLKAEPDKVGWPTYYNETRWHPCLGSDDCHVLIHSGWKCLRLNYTSAQDRCSCNVEQDIVFLNGDAFELGGSIIGYASQAFPDKQAVIDVLTSNECDAFFKVDLFATSRC